MTRPLCARCDREVETVTGGHVAGGAYEIHVICHGHVDVFTIPYELRLALSSPLSGADLVRAFVSGPGQPIPKAVDGDVGGAVPPTT